MAAIVLAMIVAVLLLAKGTPAERMLHRWLVEAPARRLLGLHRGHVAALMAALALVAIAQALGGDAPAFIAMSGGELVQWAAVVEFSTFADVAMALLGAASLSRVRLRITLGALPRLRSHRVRRQRRTARTRRKALPSDEGRGRYRQLRSRPY